MVVNYIVPESDLKIVTHGEYDQDEGKSIYNKENISQPENVKEALIETLDMNGN